jgi:hypothetical protein
LPTGPRLSLRRSQVIQLQGDQRKNLSEFLLKVCPMPCWDQALFSTHGGGGGGGSAHGIAVRNVIRVFAHLPACPPPAAHRRSSSRRR